MDIDVIIQREMIDHIAAAIADKQGSHQKAAAAIDAYLDFEPSGTQFVVRGAAGDPLERARCLVEHLKAANRKQPPWLLALHCRDAGAVIEGLLPGTPQSVVDDRRAVIKKYMTDSGLLSPEQS